MEKKEIMTENTFPPGWDDKSVKQLITHYEKQTEDEAVEEDEAVFSRSKFTVVEVPKELLPAIRELIAKHQASWAIQMDGN